MYFRMAKRMLVETDKRLLWKLFWNMGVKGLRSIQKHKRRLKRGEFFPPYLYISIINSCNLRCQGCWVDVDHKQAKIDGDALNRMIGEAKAVGNSFFGLLGGEPFMHKELFDVLESHPDAYFQVFTNGHFITADVARRLRKCGNVTPLISVEGSEMISDQRRGKSGVYGRTMQGLQHCLDHKVMTGVCTSLCQSNFELLDEAWIDRLIDMGVMYTWFHIYRPVGPAPTPELALTDEQQRQVRQFVVEMRCRKPIIIIDAYYDADGNALCPAVTGFTHHINPWGDIEPCPVIQFAVDSIHDREKSLRETFNGSEFLSDFRRTAATHTRGCIALERPDLIEQLVQRHGAKDATARKTALAELQTAGQWPSQYAPKVEKIAEKSWAYRFAKKLAFHDYGVYQTHFDAAAWVDPRKTGSASVDPSSSHLPATPNDATDELDPPRSPDPADLIQISK